MSLKIAVIVGSTRPGRVGLTVAKWFMEQVKDIPDATFELVDLAKVNLPLLDEPAPPMMNNYQHEHTKKWSALINGFDGFVFVTPEYNHGYPASLKNAIDYLHFEWVKKPVAFVGYGALGAAAAIEQLVNITAQLNMVPQPSSALKIIDIWTAFDDDGHLKPESLRGKPENLVTNLVTMAKILQPARQK